MHGLDRVFPMKELQLEARVRKRNEPCRIHYFNEYKFSELLKFKTAVYASDLEPRTNIVLRIATGIDACQQR